MLHSSTDRSQRLAQRFYSLLLAAYPSEFRRVYGREMLLVFRDLCRERSEGGLGLLRVWMRALLDLAQSAPRERLQNFRKGFDPLRALKTITLALIIYAAVVIIGGKLLLSGRAYLPHAVGAMLDSLMSIGIAFNFIALVLVSTKLLRPVRAVRAACIAVVFLLAALLAFLPAEARPNGVAVTTMVLSLLFWFGAHRLWAQRREQALS